MLARCLLPVSLSCAVAIAGCATALEPTPSCTMIAVWSLAITVRDAATAQLVCDADVLATRGDTTYRLQRIGAGEECTYYGPQETAGTFDVQASRAGYQTTTVRSVDVRSDECHVITIRLTLQLRPSS